MIIKKLETSNIRGMKILSIEFKISNVLRIRFALKIVINGRSPAKGKPHYSSFCIVFYSSRYLCDLMIEFSGFHRQTFIQNIYLLLLLRSKKSHV